MNEHDEASTSDESGAGQPQAPAGQPQWVPPVRQYPTQPPAPAWSGEGHEPAMPAQPQPRPTYEPGPAPAAWGYGPAASGGAGAPPSGSGPAWAYGPPPGEPWGAPPANRAARRHRRGRAAAAGATAGLLAVAAAGVIVGHTAWPSHTTSPTAASSPLGRGSTGTGSTGSGSGGVTNPLGSSGSGSATNPFGSSGSGSATNPFGSGGSGSSPFGSGSTSSTATSSIAAGGPSDSAAIAKKVSSGLVDIDTTLGIQGEAAAGTGMVLTSNGEILTNNHVVDGATAIRVRDIANGKTYGAKVVGYDRTQDVAVLQLTNASGLTTVDLGNSSSLKKSEQVVGVGNAGGVGGTPTYAGGVITALGQSITASDEGGGNSEKLVGLIQSNAGIEAGDSGGSLVDTSGQVVGMDTAAETSTQFQAATTAKSFAIPIDEAVSIAKQIEAGKGTTLIHIGSTALLGVEVEAAGQSATGVFGGTSGSTSTSGAAIAGVVANTPAGGAGLVEGDTITGVDGRSIASPTALTNALAGDRPGTTIQLTYSTAGGQQHTATVKLASGPPQ
jgi:S1-C subfamily serine protease